MFARVKAFSIDRKSNWSKETMSRQWPFPLLIFFLENPSFEHFWSMNEKLIIPWEPLSSVSWEIPRYLSLISRIRRSDIHPCHMGSDDDATRVPEDQGSGRERPTLKNSKRIGRSILLQKTIPWSRPQESSVVIVRLDLICARYMIWLFQNFRLIQKNLTKQVCSSFWKFSKKFEIIFE